jgi:MoaD family protein
MSVSVLLPTALRRYADDKGSLELEGSTVGALMEQLGSTYPDLKPHLFDDDGALRNFVNVFVNDDNIRDVSGTDTPVKDGDEVMLVPAVAGGVS